MLTGLSREAKTIGDHCVKPEKTKIATADEILSEKCEENYILAGVMHKLVHRDHDKQDEGGNPCAKKQKKGCNRIYQFGDRTGQTCCIITDTQETAKTLMKLVIDAPAIGQCFVLFEPTGEGHQSSRQDMPVYQTSVALLPLKDGFMQLFPTVPPKPPTLANETTFFVLHHVKLRWVQAELVGKGDVFPASCTSFLCDRKEPLRTNGACGCFSHSAKGNFSPVVLEGNILSENNDEGDDETFNIKKDRSCRTTCMFITQPDAMGIWQQSDRLSLTNTGLRASIKECCKHVNKNHGFTLCGTVARGEVQDASDEQAKVASDKIAHHICYSQPAKYALLKDAECVKLKFIHSSTLPATSTS
jgi:hypothetical protein